jgi:predicted Ser/Thr protein kinase
MSDETLRIERTPPEPVWPSFALPRGTEINGYRLDRILGSGGFGITYLALDLLRQRFAIKEYYPRQFASRQDMTVRPSTVADTPLFDECRERFLREAEALVLLGRAAGGATEGIVRVQTYFEAYGTCFLVMDYVEGDSLADIIRRDRGLTAARLRSLLVQLLTSIRVVHQAGLLHRDIKPANIIIREGDRLVLIDFGATRQAMPTEATSYTQIYSGGYGPPEQMLGQRQGEYSDIYAIGAVCYRAIGGRLADPLARQNSLAAGLPDPQKPAVVVGDGRYPRRLLEAIDAALAPDPKQRLQSADAMLQALGPEEPVGAEAAVPAPSSAMRGRRGLWLAAAAVGALAVAGAAFLVFRAPAPSPSATVAASVEQARKEPVPPTVTQPPQQQQATVVPPPVKDSPSHQQETVVGRPSAKAPPASPPVQQPQPAPNVAPPPATESQVPAAKQEALVIPPPAPVVPQPSPPSALDQAREAAGAIPCAALDVRAGQDRMEITGFAQMGQEFDRWRAGLGPAGAAVTQVDPFACPPIDAVSSLVRRTWDGTTPSLIIHPEQAAVASGAHARISVATALRAIYVDLYQADGSVHHLLRGSGRSAEWIATPPGGPRMLVAIGAIAPLDLGHRPETERASTYLDVLRPLLPKAVAADLAMVIERPPEPVAVRPQSHPLSEKCANIVSRAQLGETLTDAELAALRTECRS